MIAIIDYDAGNVKSVQKALAYLHEDTVLPRAPKQLLAAEKVILPGVGAFGDAMGKLKEYGLIDVISEIVNKNTPFLGICLGLQLLFESSSTRRSPFMNMSTAGTAISPAAANSQTCLSRLRNMSRR